jgi:hypothetical protein
VLALAACGPGDGVEGTHSDGPQSHGPQSEAAGGDGAFVRVGGLPIRYAEVQDVANHYRGALPAASANEVERLALTAYLIPRAAFEALAPAERERALERATARLAELRGEVGAGSTEPGVSGRQADSAARIAPPVWRALDALYAGVEPLEPMGPAPVEPADQEDPFQPVQPTDWVGPLEDTGSFMLVRLVGVVPGPPRGYEFEFEEFHFRDYEGTREDYYTQVFGAGLELVEPFSRELVPRHWQLEMGATD